MTSQYDLTGVTEARVANQEVDLFMANGQTIWQKPSAVPLYNVFSGAAMSNFSDFNDYSAVANRFIVNQFGKFTGAPLYITNVGIWVPNGSALIGLTGSVTVELKTTDVVGGGPFSHNLSAKEVSIPAPLVAGWNWIPLASPVLWMDDNAACLVGYHLGTHYQSNTVLDANGINAPGPRFRLNPQASRSFYVKPSDGLLYATTSHSYGIDLQCSDVGTTIDFDLAVDANDGYLYTESSNGAWPPSGSPVPAMSGGVVLTKQGDDFSELNRTGFLRWDTSSIPDGATIKSVVLRMWASSRAGTIQLKGDYLSSWHGSGGNVPNATDYVTDIPGTSIFTPKAISAFTLNAWNVIALNDLSGISKTGYTYIRLALGAFSSGSEQIGFDSIGQSRPPRLSVTYT